MPDIHDTLRERLASIEERIQRACVRCGRARDSITLIGVTKSVNAEVATALLELGVVNLAENRPQELWKKAEAIPAARWHFIGHLQRNKLARTLPCVSLFHSVDSMRLLEALSAAGTQRGQPVPLLLEVNCSAEETKGGFAPNDILPMSDKLLSLGGVELRGLMTMAAYHDDPELCRPTFTQLRVLRDELRLRTGWPLPELSMGMSNDFEIAIEEGATFIRLGTVLFES